MLMTAKNDLDLLSSVFFNVLAYVGFINCSIVAVRGRSQLQLIEITKEVSLITTNMKIGNKYSNQL